uniref:(northern house mosquito) hypothetical protein n=1 Tax=Culex pipiens TaxID=7175 RepID=A0A8D8HBH4_CULPI
MIVFDKVCNHYFKGCFAGYGVEKHYQRFAKRTDCPDFSLVFRGNDAQLEVIFLHKFMRLIPIYLDPFSQPGPELLQKFLFYFLVKNNFFQRILRCIRAGHELFLNLA